MESTDISFGDINEPLEISCLRFPAQLNFEFTQDDTTEQFEDDFTSTLATARRDFRQVIKNYADMKEKKDEYLSMNNIEGTIIADIPADDSHRQGLVSQLFGAFYDGTNTIDGPESNPYRAIMEKDHYPEGAVHLALWGLLVR
jgi:hypothetical protein